MTLGGAAPAPAPAEQAAPSPGARIEGVAHQVEVKPAGGDWENAHPGVVVKPRDGVRTDAQASIALVLGDGTGVVLSEGTLVYLRGVDARLAARGRRAIEVRAGQADYVHPEPGASGELDVTLGLASARARSGPGGEAARARFRRTESGVAQLMVQSGEGELTSRGEIVSVPAGMGAIAAPGQSPSAIEPLLPAPRTVAPEPGSRAHQANPDLIWAVVPGAEAYVVEVCLDPRCGQVVERTAGVQATRIASRDLPVGDLHWRVTAVGASGLDGFPSAPVPFSVTSRWRAPRR